MQNLKTTFIVCIGKTCPLVTAWGCTLSKGPFYLQDLLKSSVHWVASLGVQYTSEILSALSPTRDIQRQDLVTTWLVSGFPINIPSLHMTPASPHPVSGTTEGRALLCLVCLHTHFQCFQGGQHSEMALLTSALWG